MRIMHMSIQVPLAPQSRSVLTRFSRKRWRVGCTPPPNLWCGRSPCTRTNTRHMRMRTMPIQVASASRATEHSHTRLPLAQTLECERLHLPPPTPTELVARPPPLHSRARIHARPACPRRHKGTLTDWYARAVGQPCSPHALSLSLLCLYVAVVASPKPRH